MYIRVRVLTKTYTYNISNAVNEKVVVQMIQFSSCVFLQKTSIVVYCDLVFISVKLFLLRFLCSGNLTEGVYASELRFYVKTAIYSNS